MVAGGAALIAKTTVTGLSYLAPALGGLLFGNIELVFKSNIFGYKSFMPGRIASFSGNELNIGHYFSAFCLTFMSFVYLNNKNISINLIIAIILIIISFLIGERSNFIRTLLIISVFVFLIFV